MSYKGSNKKLLFDTVSYAESPSSVPASPFKNNIYLHHEVLFPFTSKLGEHTFEIRSIDLSGKFFEDFQFSNEKQQPFTISRVTEEVEKSTSLGKLAMVMFTKKHQPIIQDMPYFQGKFSQPKRKGFFQFGFPTAQAMHVSNEVKDFFIPDIGMLFVFLSILKAKNIECCLLNHHSTTAQVIHTAIAMDNIYKSKGLLTVGDLAHSYDPSVTIFTAYDPKNNYSEHLLKILQEILKKCSKDFSVNFKNQKMYGLVERFVNLKFSVQYKDVLANMIIHQFNEGTFCRYETAVVDYTRCFLDAIMIQNKDVLMLGYGSRTPEGGMQNLAERMHQTLITLSSAAPLDPYFLPAFLILSINQGSLAYYLASFFTHMILIFQKRQKSIEFNTILHIEKVEVKSNEIILGLRMESKGLEKNELDSNDQSSWKDSSVILNASFNYVFNISSKEISVNEVEIDFSPYLEKQLCYIYPDALKEQKKFPSKSDQSAWGRITNIAHLIGGNKLDVGMVDFMSKQGSQRESTC